MTLFTGLLYVIVFCRALITTALNALLASKLVEAVEQQDELCGTPGRVAERLQGRRHGEPLSVRSEVEARSIRGGLYCCFFCSACRRSFARSPWRILVIA